LRGEKTTKQSEVKRNGETALCFHHDQCQTYDYTGVTNDLKRRVWEHKRKLVEGFTKKYHIDMLLCYEVGESIEGAIMREKQIKAGSRKKKITLINNMNCEWHDLYDEL